MASVDIIRQAVVGGEEEVCGVDLGGLVGVVDVVRGVGVVWVQHVREGAAEVG